MSWQNIFILMANYKLSSSSSKPSKKEPKKTPKIPPLKGVLLPPHSPLPFPTFFSYIYSSNHPKTPYLQCFERKRTQKRTKKEEDICILIRKLSQKYLMAV